MKPAKKDKPNPRKSNSTSQKKPFNKKAGFDKKNAAKKTPFFSKESKEPRERKSFGDKREGNRKEFFKKSYSDEGRGFGDRNYTNKKKSFGGESGRERKSYSRNDGDRQEGRRFSKGSDFERNEPRERKSFGDKREGNRKEFFKKSYSDEGRGFGDRKFGNRPFQNRERFEQDEASEEFDPYAVRRSERNPERDSDNYREFKRPSARGKHEDAKFSRTTKSFVIKKKKPEPEEVHREKLGLLSKLNKNSKFTDIHDDEDELPSEMRINRFLAKCGFGSRRDAEKLIADGKVKVNGKMTQDFSLKVQIGKDEVDVNGEIVTPIIRNLTIAFNKPVGYICSHFDLHNENTVFHLLPKEYKRFFLAGRLDVTSRGLMILSSDGDLIQTLSHPSFHQKKTYRLAVENCPDEKSLRESFLRGIEDDGDFLRAKDVEVLDRERGIVRVVLEEGKKRQLHRMFAKVGSKVLDLQRTQIGKLKLDDLGISEGEFKQIEKDDIFY